MGRSYGYRVLEESIGRSLNLVADGEPIMKPGGVTIDWATFTALAADQVFPHGIKAKAGQKICRVGQPLAMIGLDEVQTVALSASLTSGDFTLTLPALGDDPALTVTLPYNVTADAMRDALRGLWRIGYDGLKSVALASTTYTLTFNRLLGNVPQLTSTLGTLAGGTPGITHATTTGAGASAGKFGPYDPDATDGRQNTPARGQIYLAAATVHEDDPESDHVPALEGGLVWKARVIATYQTASLGRGPTFANLEAAMPLLSWA